MSKRIWVYFALTVLLLCSVFPSLASEENYSCALIPDSLKKNADAVVRKFHEQVTISSASSILISRVIVVTILNENGQTAGTLREYYNDYTHIKHIRGRLYDKDGRQISKLTQNSIIDGATNGGSFVGDAHYKVFDFGYSQYPYTCEYEIETEHKNSLSLPAFQPSLKYHCSVEDAAITVTYPSDMLLRYRTFHISKSVTESQNSDGRKLSLSVDHLPARVVPDAFSTDEYSGLPSLVFVIDKFELYGVAGNMSTWKDFGKFFYDLNNNRDDLPEETKKTVHQLTDTCHSEMQKICILYEYLKTNMRYVSIQLGIGGWQTFEAKFVCEKGYGDCKALSNLMKGLLREAGITSYLALAFSDQSAKHSMTPDFPHNQFNHVILCVPRKGDTVWIECTSKSLPAGYLSSSTGNRLVLLLTPAGGFCVKTPYYGIAENTAYRNADIVVNATDEMNATIDLKYSGYLWDREAQLVVNKPKSGTDNYMNSRFSIANYTTEKYEVKNDLSTIIPCVKESIVIHGNGNSSRSGKNFFFSPVILPLYIAEPTSFDERKEPFYLSFSCRITDTFTYHFPDRYSMEKPKEANISTPFGVYNLAIRLTDEHTLRVTVSYVQQEGKYAPELFKDYIRMSKEANYNLTKTKILLTMKE